ncbi:MAG: GNAT family N-acetyltransferase [Bryobacteraceae bacterium]|jgi:GNAT superfamily N-acetyltransferase
MELEYRESLPDPSEYFALFESAGWNQEYGLTPGELHGAVGRSWFLLTAYWEGRLVGTGRVISDGVLHALIVDVIVLPEYQGSGIGTSIMARLIERCLDARIRDVQLFCARGKAPFYRRLGFVDRSADAPGMDFKGPPVQTDAAS